MLACYMYLTIKLFMLSISIIKPSTADCLISFDLEWSGMSAIVKHAFNNQCISTDGINNSAHSYFFPVSLADKDLFIQIKVCDRTKAGCRVSFQESFLSPWLWIHPSDLNISSLVSDQMLSQWTLFNLWHSDFYIQVRWSSLCSPPSHSTLSNSWTDLG